MAIGAHPSHINETSNDWYYSQKIYFGILVMKYGIDVEISQLIITIIPRGCYLMLHMLLHSYIYLLIKV